MRRSEVWWAHLPPPYGSRPVLIVTRDRGVDIRELVTVAIVTSRVRGISAEVPLDQSDGMSRHCVINTDVLLTVDKVLLERRLCVLGPAKRAAADLALRFSLGLD